jgi:hypothetical protein
MFYQRYKSAPMPAVVRVHGTSGVLAARMVEVDIDLACEVLTAEGTILHGKALSDLDNKMRALFEGKLLIDNNDPHADDIMKLKRIGAADPVLFDHGTSGAQLSFYVGRMVEDWLKAERWNPEAGEIGHVTVALAVVRLGRDEFFYDLV